MNTQLYYNTQPKLTKEVIEDVKALPAGVNIYKAIEVAAPVDLYVHCYQYKPNMDGILAMATLMGCNITLNIESIKEVLVIPALLNRTLREFRERDRTIGYEHIQNNLRPYSSELYQAQQEIQYLRSKNDQPLVFKVTPEVESFIRTYAPAYGIQLPRFQESDTTVNDYLPKHWYKSYNEIVGDDLHAGVVDPEKAFTKWDDRIKQSKQPTPLIEIQRIFNSLMFYVRNGIPFNDNYTVCPQCKKPMRTNRHGISELIENPVCPDCSVEQVVDRCVSFQDFMALNESGRKVTTEKNALDA